MNQTLIVLVVRDLPNNWTGERLEVKVLRWSTGQQVDQHARLASLVQVLTLMQVSVGLISHDGSLLAVKQIFDFLDCLRQVLEGYLMKTKSLELSWGRYSSGQ